jgi:hypothetical protein
MRPLTLESATPDLVGTRLFCARARAFYPVVTVTSVEVRHAGGKVPAMVFLGFTADDPGEFLLELADHPNTRILVDAAGSPWQILEPGEDPPD